jgi:hypothetical protein
LVFLASCEDDPAAPKGDPSPASPTEVIEFFEAAYRELNPEAYTRLLANDPDHAADFVFLLAGFVPGQASWGYNEEARIHRRMFRHEAGPGEPEVPPEYWLAAINISLTQVTDWAERTDLYRTDTNADGLPPEKWKAVDARYSTYAFFDTQTDNDFLIEGEAIFTVIEDLEKSGAEPGRFLLLQWQDVDADLEKEERNWSNVKQLYR